MLSSPRRPSSTMRIFSSAEWCRRVARRISRTVFSALSGTRLLACLIVAPQQGYDEPGILSYAIRPFCPTSADGLQCDQEALQWKRLVKLKIRSIKQFGSLLYHFLNFRPAFLHRGKHKIGSVEFGSSRIDSHKDVEDPAIGKFVGYTVQFLNPKMPVISKKRK